MNNVESGLSTTQLAGRLTGNMPWADDARYTIRQGIEEAEAAGMTVVYPKPNELFLDIDSKEGDERFYSVFGMLDSFFGVLDHQVTTSKSGPLHYHYTVQLSVNISDIERVLLQAIMGSDPKREMLSYVRLLRNIEHPTVFFEPPAGEKKELDLNDLF